MLQNEKGKVTDVSKNTTIEFSRAYTFLDSYIYMRNGKYNALYEKNKEILAIEKVAIEQENAAALYSAATEQALALNSVIVRIRTFTQECRRDVLRNLDLILPTTDELNDFDEAISSMSNIPRLKVLKYQINPIVYPNMAVFLALFKKEIDEYVGINNDTSSRTNPFHHNVATKFLIDTAEKFANNDVGILGKESMEIANKQELIRILNYLRRKQMILDIVVKDFRTFYVYLRQYSALDRVNDAMKPTVMNDGSIKIGTSGVVKSFHDYLIIYKHYTMMIKNLMDTLSNFDSKFFNKIYAIQSNIECYRSIINNVVSVYKTRMRNIDEGFNDVAGAIGGPEIAIQYLNDDGKGITDEANKLEDSIDGLPIKDSISDELDIFDDPYDKDPNVNSEFSKYKESNISGKIDPDYHDPRKYLGGINPEDRAEDSLLMVYDNAKMNDLRFNKDKVLKEAAEAQKSYKDILQNILESIISSNDKFKDSAATIHSQYGDIHERCKNIDIQSYDLSGIQFEIYNFPKGVEFMHHIRIPSFRESDAGLLLDSNGIPYKQKYFGNLYYFNQNDVPINMTRFRGSLAQKSIQQYGPAEMFAWFINYIETYDKIINAVSHANARIKSAINRGIQLFDLAYGGDDRELTEAILINRSQFKNDIFKILLEDGEDYQQAQEQYAAQQQYEEAPQEEQQVQQQEIPQEQQVQEVPQQQQQPPQQQQLNPDEKAAQNANNSAQLYQAIIQYVKIANEVNSARMLMYETVLSQSFEYLKLILDSISMSGQQNEEQPQEAPQQQEQQQQAAPQQQQNVPQEQQVQQQEIPQEQQVQEQQQAVQQQPQQ